MAAPKKLQWDLKGSTRENWRVLAENIGITQSNEDDWYETNWFVSIVHESGGHTQQFPCTTQYDQPLKISQVAQEAHAHFMIFYDAAIRDGT